MVKSIIKNNKYLIFGKPSKYGNSISFVHPEMDLIKSNNHKTFYPIYPVYHSTEKLKAIGLNSKGISQLVATLLKNYKHEFQENLSDSILNKHAFLNRKLA